MSDITNCAIGDLVTANSAIGGIPLLGLTHRFRSLLAQLPTHFDSPSLLLLLAPPATMTFIQDLLKPGGGIALIPFIRGTIATLLVLVM